MAHYRKVEVKIWNDEKFNALSNDAKLIFFMLLTHPHMTPIGAMRGTPEGLAAELKMEIKGFREGFREVCDKAIAKYDEYASFIWLPNFLKYNKPESPNVIKAWVSSVDMLPECKLKAASLLAAKGYTEGLTEGYAKAFNEAFGKAMRNQEQEQEQEQEQDLPPPSQARDVLTKLNISIPPAQFLATGTEDF